MEKGTGGGRWFGKETDQSKQDKLERVNTNIEEVSKPVEISCTNQILHSFFFLLAGLVHYDAQFVSHILI